VTTHGGRTGTGIDAVEWCARAEALGAGEILLNSMDADGTRDGFDLALCGTRSADAAGDAVRTLREHGAEVLWRHRAR